MLRLERIGDEAWSAENHDDAISAYSIALMLTPSTPNAVQINWATIMLIRGSANEALSVATKVCFT